MGDATEVQESSASESKFTLAELAKRSGNAQRRKSSESSGFSARHMVADVRHGWSMFQIATGQEIRLTEAEYAAALEASDGGSTHAPVNKRDAEQERKADESLAQAQAQEQQPKNKGKARKGDAQ